MNWANGCYIARGDQAGGVETIIDLDRLRLARFGFRLLLHDALSLPHGFAPLAAGPIRRLYDQWFGDEAVAFVINLPGEGL
jgi:hypothetical protein